MKGSIKKTSLVILTGLGSLIMGCQNDEVIDNLDGTLQIGQYEQEVFDDLTTDEVQSLQTPYEESMTAANPSNGRTMGGSTSIMIDALVEILGEARFKGIEADEERGLAVYRIKFQLEGGGYIEIALIKDIFQILEIVGYGGSLDYNLDPQSGFISLQVAFEKAIAAHSGTVVHWELELEEDNKWEYEIHIENDAGRFEVEIDAFTGDVLEINELDEEDEKEFEKDEDDQHDEEVEEREKHKLPEDIKIALSAMTDARLTLAEKEEGDKNERDIWSIYVKTEHDAVIYLEITDDTEDLIYAKGDEGPFDYDLIIGGDFISLKEALLMVNNEMQSETYYWYYEQVEVEDKVRWAFVIKVKDHKGVYHKIAVDAITTDWLSFETFD
ncbi:MAG: PepSY domain-containing protein [Cyclobacteriaceae bacterium]